MKEGETGKGREKRTRTAEVKAEEQGETVDWGRGRERAGEKKKRKMQGTKKKRTRRGKRGGEFRRNERKCV